MDKQEEPKEAFYKVRSVKACVTDGLLLPVRNFLPLMRMLWLPMLISALCMAVLTTAVSPLADWLARGPLMSGMSYAGCWMMAKVVIQLWIILILGSLTLGQLGAAVTLYARLGYIPKMTMKETCKYMVHNYFKAFQWNLCWIMGYRLLALISFIFLGLSMEWTYGFVIPLGFLLWFVPFCLLGIKMLIDEEGRLTWWGAWKLAYKYWDSVFAVVLVCGLLALAYMAVGFLPAGILSYAEMSYRISLSVGDAVTNPSFFLYGRMFFSFISFLFCSMALWTVFFPLSYLFASLCVKSDMQRKYDELESGVDSE